MRRWASLILVAACAVTGGKAHSQDEHELPTPVTVKTKRGSIEPRSLPRLIELTEERSPAVQKAKNTFTIAKLQYENASKAWLPNLDLDVTQGLRGQSPPNTGWAPTPWFSGLNLVASENLYDNGVAFTNYEIAKRRFDYFKIQYELDRDQQLLNVANAYYDWSAALQQHDILENKRDLLRRQFNILESQYKQGLKTKRDVLRLETEIRKLELDVLSSNDDIDLGFQKLASAVGMARAELENEDIEGEEAKPYVSVDVTNEELKAANHRRAKIFELQEREAALQTRLVQRTYLPQIGAQAQAGYHNVDYFDNPSSAYFGQNQYWDWQALVTLKYNLWDFGVRRRNVEIAHVNEKNLADVNHQALLDLSSDLRNVTLQLRTFRENVKMTRELLVLEQQSYAILEVEYRNGHTNYLDLILNLNSLIDARSRFNASYYGLKKQQAAYAFHQGVIYENFKPK